MIGLATRSTDAEGRRCAMGRTLVLCSDGTGNTHVGRVSNVGRLVECLELGSAGQLVAYDQGLGTVGRRERVAPQRVDGGAADGRAGLCLLPAPTGGLLRPWAWRRQVGGLLTGYGLEENVGQLYRWLAAGYRGPDDSVLLFGFSRGAFTVRALAGLLYRCGLPAWDCPDVDERFALSWRLFQSVRPSEAERSEVAELRSDHRPCPVHFIGLWDTVKSYGGLRPVLLPHLRHNPTVCHVRHALALDERRAWFKHTTWGRLDSDRTGAMRRVSVAERADLERQDVLEVWFSGCHADVGGGELLGRPQPESSRIALRWMLREAVEVTPGLVLNAAGVRLLAEPDRPDQVRVRQSWTRWWRAVEQVPRQEIDNTGEYPVRVRHRGSDGVRDVLKSRREKGKVFFHASVRPRVEGQAGRADPLPRGVLDPGSAAAVRFVPP
jgi:uncharacterized protein (DUF2235 family)